jgi:hypothetical protein
MRLSLSTLVVVILLFTTVSCSNLNDTDPCKECSTYLCRKICQDLIRNKNTNIPSPSECGFGNFSCSGSCIDSQGKVTLTNSDEIERIEKVGDLFAYVYEASGFDQISGIPKFVSDTFCVQSPQSAQFPVMNCQEVGSKTVLKDVTYDSCDSFTKVIRKTGDGGILCRVKCARHVPV